MTGEITKFDLCKYYEKHLASLWRRAPFVLRITEMEDIVKIGGVHGSKVFLSLLHLKPEYPPMSNDL